MEFGNAMDSILRGVNAILASRPYSEIPADQMPEQLRPLAEKINALAIAVKQVTTCLISLSKGRLDIELPPSSNAIAGGVKQLHSHLQHLTWQTQQIAAGDYNQSVDYMGEFSEAFNSMIAQLKEREDKLNANSIIMASVFDHVENMFIINERLRNQAYIVNACARKTFDIEEGTSDLSEAMQRSEFLDTLFRVELMDDLQIDLYDADADKWYYVITSRLSWHGEDAVLIYCTDITDQKHREALLEQSAMTDPLTGIANRRSMDVNVEQCWQHYKRMKLPISAIIVDIDHFKRYNDTYGHQQGDVCLQQVAACLRRTISRSTDIVARYGGEEFFAMLPNTNSEGAKTVAEKLRANIEALEISCDNEGDTVTHITCSIGVATCVPTAMASPEDLIKVADDALYRAKEGGRNRVVVVDC